MEEKSEKEKDDMKQWMMLLLIVLAGILVWKFAFPSSNIYSEFITVQGHSCPAGTKEFGCEFGTSLVCTCQRFIPCVTDSDCANLPVQCPGGQKPKLTCPYNSGQQTYCDSACVASGTPNPGISNPPSNIGELILQKLKDWISSLLDWLFPASLTASSQTASPGSPVTFNIDMTVSADSDCSDGKCDQLFGGWALYDSSYNVVQQSDWTYLNSNNYKATVNINAPANNGNYVFVSVIYKKSLSYVLSQWTVQSEDIAAKEGVKLTVGIPAPGVNVPSSNVFAQLIASIFAWIKSLFGW